MTALEIIRVPFVKVNTNFTELYNEIGGEDGVLSSPKLTQIKLLLTKPNANIILDPNGTGKVEVDGDSLFVVVQLQQDNPEVQHYK